MFHNGGNLSFSCNEMSATSTPHRHPRGVSVPYIDTRASMPKAATALQCGGWLTPPQSAHESRRPSLAYSSYSDMPYSAASTATGFSLPSTPSRSIPEHPHHNSQSLSQGHINLDLQSSLGGSHLSQDLIHLNLESQSGCELGHDATWSTQPMISHGPDDYHDHFDPEQAENMWQLHGVPDNSFLHQPTGLQSTLFPVSHGMTADHHTIPSTYDSTTCPMDSNVSDFHALQINNYQVACYQPTEMVEPLLVNPQHEYADQHYSMLESPGSSPQDLSASFASGFSSSFEEIHTPGPDLDYCEEADEGWLQIKKEVETSPMSTSYVKSSRARTGGRRASKRARRVRVVQISNGIDLQLEGEGVAFEDDRLVLSGNFAAKKSFACGHVDEDGRRCKSAFARSEHLKRHSSKHSNERKFPCVLPDCDKKIGRSDNACDHFRTHLQPYKKNKRNKHFHWREIERRVRWSYQEKVAAKILVNLERWLEKECLADEKLREAHMDDMWEPNNEPMLAKDGQRD